ncbi:MAG: glycosyltransferase family 4 protein [Aridibacter sp.]
MKVLQTLDSLNRGGAEILTLDVCRNARRFGIDIVFTAFGNGDLEEDFKVSGAEFIRLQRDLPVDLNLIWQLRKIIHEQKIEIVHSHQSVETLHIFLATLGMKNIKIVQTHHGFISGKKNTLIAKNLSPKIDANIACSRGVFPWLRKEIGLDTSKNFYLIYNGVDEKRLRASGISIKRELGFSEESLLLGMIANFRPDQTKDQMTVCRALPKVFEKYEAANFIFVGKVSAGGEDNFEKCINFCDENGIGEKVFFLGDREDVNDILASLDLFVFSSLKEGLPISAVEAMLAKVPLIVSDIPPLLEVTNNGKCAEIFKTKNSEEVSEKVLKLLENKDLRNNLAEDAFAFARQNFSIEAHLRGLKTLYLKLQNQANINEAKENNQTILNLE